MAAGVAVIACLLTVLVLGALVNASFANSCPQPDDPTCHTASSGLGQVGFGLALAAIGVLLLSVAVAVGWGRPAPAFRWFLVFALLMAPMPMAAGIALLLLFLPAGWQVAAAISIAVAVLWMVAWARLARWASVRLPVASAEPA